MFLTCMNQMRIIDEKLLCFVAKCILHGLMLCAITFRVILLIPPLVKFAEYPPARLWISLQGLIKEAQQDVFVDVALQMKFIFVELIGDAVNIV